MSKLKAIGIGVGSVGAMMALSLAGMGWQYVTAPLKGRVEAERQLESGASRTALYNRFFDKCAGVQTVETQIASQRELLAGLKKDAPEYSRTLQNIAGLQARRAGLINGYNADAAKDYTAARFHDADLPYRLDPGAAKTVCAP